MADRREFLQALSVLGIASATAGAANAVSPPPKLHRLIATEEGFSIRELVAASQGWYAAHPDEEPGVRAMFQSIDPNVMRGWFEGLVDFGVARESAMDDAGIDTQVLVVANAVQVLSPEEGTRLSALVNDRIAEIAKANPRRYAPLATIAPQDPASAAKELERAVQKLGMHGGLINSHTKGEYLDDPKFWPIFEAAEALDVPIYLHPREPSPQMIAPYVDHGLVGPVWGYAAETGLHALRILMAGVFDRFPRLQIVLGHMGEGLTFFADRIDTRYLEDGSPQRIKLGKLPSEYLRSNFAITTSGMNWAPALLQALSVVGEDRVMFAADWPFENAKRSADSFRAMDLPEPLRRKIAYENAERIFRIAPIGA